MTRIMLAAMALLWAGAAQAQMTPVGLWRSIDDKTGEAKAEIRITANAAGVLSGRIERALVTSGEPLCTKCTDDRKDKPKIGMEIIRNVRKAADRLVWEDGEVLDPDNGSTYALRLTPIEGGTKLEVRGSLLFFFRTQTWQRVQ